MTFEDLTEQHIDACVAMQSISVPWSTLGLNKETLRSNLSREGLTKIVALESDRVLGFYVLETVGILRAYLKTLCVHPDFRGQGLGSKLVAHAEETGFTGSPNVFLCVSSFNPRARGFYESLGYQQIGELADFIVSGESEIVMRKTRGPWIEH